MYIIFTDFFFKITFKPIFLKIMNMHIKLQKDHLSPDSFHVCTSIKRVSL